MLTLPVLASLTIIGALAAVASAQAGDAATGEATLGIDGRLRIAVAGEEICTFSPVMANPQWRFASLKPASPHPSGGTRKFFLSLDENVIAGEAAVSNGQDDVVNAEWTFTGGKADQRTSALAISTDLPADEWVGAEWTADGKSGRFPRQPGPSQLFSGPVRAFTLGSGARRLTIRFNQATPILIQDGRQWGPNFVVRIGWQGEQIAAGQRYELPMTIGANVPVTAKLDTMVKIAAGDQWIPLDTQLEIEPGSALDLSGFGFAEGPCGKDGWIIATPDGHFAFEKRPDEAQRFYGVNLCFTAHYLPKAQIDQLCDRLLRLGYNTLRIHHYERDLTIGKSGFEWNPEKLDQLDYLLAACGKRGIYVTTDLYVSRSISAAQVGLGGSESWTYRYKVLVPVHEPAFEDYQQFARRLLDRVNPYTNLRWADDPTLAWISLINEGNFGNYWNDVKAIPQWTAAWNRWLAARYADRAALHQAWGDELKTEEDAASGSVKLPGQLDGDSPRHRDCTLFLAET